MTRIRTQPRAAGVANPTWWRVLRFAAAARDRPVLVAAGVALGWLLCLLILFQPRFATNDDPAMLGMARGTFSWPSARLVYISVPVGVVLRAAYTTFPALPWYALLLYAAQFMAVTVLIYVALTHEWKGPLLGTVTFAAVVAMFHAQAAVLLQFTSTAMLVSAAGVALFCRVPGPGGSASLWTAVAAGVLVGGGSTLRDSATIGVVALAVPFLFAAARRQGLRRGLFFAGASTAVVLAVLGTSAWAYGSDPSWSKYREFNSLRSELHDSSRLVLDEQVVAALDDVGWSENDFAMFQRWFFTDERRYTTEALRDLLEATDHRAALAPGPVTLGTLALSGEAYRTLWHGFSRELMLCGGLLLAGLVSLRGGRRWLVAGGGVWALALLWYLALYARLPGRVGLPLLMGLATLLALTWQASSHSEFGPLLALLERAAVVVLVAVLGVSAYSVHQEFSARSRRHNEQQAQLQVLYERLHRFDAEGVYVSWAGALPQEWLDPMSEYRDLAPLHRIGLGWPTGSPHHRRLLARHGIDDLPLAIARDGGVYLLTRQHALVTYLERYVAEHHGIDGCMRRVFEPGSGIIVWDVMLGIDGLRDAGATEDLRRCMEIRRPVTDSLDG